MTEKQGMIIGVGALAAVFLLKARKGAAAVPKGVAIKPTAQSAPGHVSGSLAQPVSTNLATGNGQRTTAQVPSIAGFGTAIAATASIFSKLFGSKSTAPTGAAPKPKPSAGPGGGGSAGSGAGSGGAVKPGAAANAGAFLPDGTFVGGSTTGSSYDASSYLGINPQTGLYDPNYDPSVVFNPESNGEPVDPSMLPGPVFDENGLLTTDLPALGADGGDDPLAYFADTAVSPDGPPPDVSVADLGAVDPSMFDAGTVDQSFAIGDDYGGGGGDAGYWDDAIS